MSDSKIVQLFPASSSGSSGKKSRKREITPEHYICNPQQLAECILPDIPVTPYDRSKIRKLITKHGLWWSIILDETESVIGGCKALKTLKDRAQTVPVVRILNLTAAQKVICGRLIKEWEGEHGLWFF
jgi:hypothetical protein